MNSKFNAIRFPAKLHEKYVFSGLLIVILSAAAAIRFYSLSFGLPALNDPDELMFELGAVRMLRGLTLNPGWFGHPATTTMYVLAIVNALVFGVGWVFGWFEDPKHFGDVIYADPSWVILPGRAAMVVFGLLVIFLAYRVSCRLFSRRAGLFTALILMASPLHIKFSQIIRSDMMACAFMLACLLAAIRAARGTGFRPYGATAMWLGIAVATKWPFAAVGLAGIGAGFLRIEQALVDSRRREVLRILAFGLLSVLVLVLVSPYLLIDYRTVMTNLQGESRPFHLGATGGSALWNLGWYMKGPILSAMGILGLFLTVVGVISARRNREVTYLILPVLFGFLVILLTQQLVWDRWALPVLVLMAILAGQGADTLLRLFKERWLSLATASLGVAIVAPLTVQAWAETRERLNDTRQQATSWLVQNAPPGSKILIEQFSWDLASHPYKVFFPLGDAGCVDALAMLRGKVGYRTIEILRKARSNVDIGTLPVTALARCKVDYAVLAQADRYFAEQKQFPTEAENYRKLISQGQTVAVFQPISGVSGGPAVRIIHFKKHP